MVAFQVEYIFDKVCANDFSLAKPRLSSKSGLVSETLYDCQHHGPCDPSRMDDYKDGAWSAGICKGGMQNMFIDWYK